MAYFPFDTEREYVCPGCGGRYIQGNISCCVLHAPGTCCHYGDTPLPTPERQKHFGQDD